MKLKGLVLLIITTIAVASVIISMIATIDSTKYRNDFVRIFPPHAADVYRAVKYDRRFMSIAGISKGVVYLQSNGYLKGLSLNMQDTCAVLTHSWPAKEINIHGSYFFVQNGATGVLHRGSIDDWRIDSVFKNLPGFIDAQPISNGTAVLKTIDRIRRKSIFIGTSSPHIQKDLLQTQVDGILCTDGHLQYSHSENMLVYTYRYRNQFLCIDTGLNLVRKGKTIDTTSVAKIAVAETDGKIIMSKPPFVVNRTTSVAGKHLFVNSNLVARNESAEVVKNRSVIDVYDITDGSYLYSFYIYDEAKEKMQSFMVQDSFLIATFKNYVARYDLATPYLHH
jgi:hypothetical protein